MYLPEHFVENRPELLIPMIQQHALGCLITQENGELDANHLPFIYDELNESLLAHIAKANPLYTQLKQGLEVLVVFQIDHAYVSPNWYAGKFEHHEAVPTWNYVVIHVKGKAELIEDLKQLRGILARLTRQHEVKQPKPWKMTDAPNDYIEAELQDIVGLQIHVSKLIGKFKLSQNRESQDIKNVAEQFSLQSKTGLSTLMRERLYMAKIKGMG